MITMAKYVFYGIIGGFIALLCFGAAFFLFETRALLPLPKSEVFFTIAPGQGGKEISNQLQKEGIIRYPFVFYWYTKFSGKDRGLQAGLYRLSGHLAIPDLVSLFNQGPNAYTSITFPEGFTVKQIVARLQERGFALKEEDFAVIPLETRSVYSFLADVPGNASLEGFLFPDTYNFRADASAKDIRDSFLVNFKKRVQPLLADAPDKGKHTLFDVLTMGSILERELRKFEDKKIASGLLWRRLSIGLPLQVDATVNYITQKHTASLTNDDLSLDSRYNTYIYAGLPPGPISNPGIESIKAALLPKESEYWFYLSRQDTGETIFSKTLQEHNMAKAKYLSR